MNEGCLHPGCTQPKRPRGIKGPSPKYCAEHGKHRWVVWRRAEALGLHPRQAKKVSGEPVPLPTGTRTCARCGERFEVRAPAQRYCNIRCYALAKGAHLEPPPRRTR